MVAKKKTNSFQEVNQKFSDSIIPELKKNLGTPYIKFGDKNDYPDYLLQLYNKSPNHRAIINGKVKYIYGGGYNFEGQDPKTAEFIKKLEKITAQCLTDIETFGGCYIEIIPSQFEGYFGIHHVDFKTIRTNEDCTKFFYKKDWIKSFGEEKEIEIPAYQPGLKCKSIFAYKEYTPYSSVYALPGYIAALNYIESDMEVSKAVLTNAKTGFSATKFINFYNGEPSEEDKRDITRRLEDAATGAEGRKLLIGFNNDPNKKPTVDDLGVSDLSKENFSNINNVIDNKMYASHEITHPLLFGIQQEGKLGSSQELRVAYDIFKNTYVNYKQANWNKIINYFGKLHGISDLIYLTDVDPVGFEFSEQTMLEVAPKAWLLEKMGIDPKDYPNETALGTPVVNQTTSESLANENLKNLTGRQGQTIERIIRKYKSGTYTPEQAKIMLKGGFGLSDEEVTAMLGIQVKAKSEFSQHESDDFLFSLFEAHGESVDNYEVKSSKHATFKEEDESEMISLAFKENNETAKPPVKPPRVDIKTPQFLVRYSYEKRADVSGPDILPNNRTRPFCQRMVKANKFYSRQDINQISLILGYNVFEQVGGFWNDNGVIKPHCRHIWKANIVVKK